jgi:hypothetical protein
LRITFTWLEEHNIRVLATGVTGPVRDLMKRSEFLDLIGADNIYWLHHDAARVAKDMIRDINKRHEEHAVNDINGSLSSIGSNDDDDIPVEILARNSEFGGAVKSMSFVERPKAALSFWQKLL